jgi:phosphoribosylanthranilate isomerase
MADLPRIKICGLREPRHGALASELGVWAIGLVFASGSPRLVDAPTARSVVDATSRDVAKVGVFVDTSPGEIAALAVEVGLTHVQVHGNHDIRALRSLCQLPVLEGVGVATVEDLRHVGESDADLVLLDARVPGAHGGTGVRADWQLIGDNRPERPFLLAGGLDSENVAAAIDRLHPWGVDVSSGVESARGMKDSDLMAAFVSAVQQSG